VDWINLAQDTDEFEHGRWNFVPHKWLGISWLPEELATQGRSTPLYGDSPHFCVTLLAVWVHVSQLGLLPQEEHLKLTRYVAMV
jgi:hypothetical protein